MQRQRQVLDGDVQRGLSALHSGDFETAREIFSNLASSEQSTAQAWLLLAQACDGCGDSVAALAAVDRVLEGDRNNPFALLIKGDIFARRADDRAAVSFYRMAIRRCAEFPQLQKDLQHWLDRARTAVAAAEQRFEQQVHDRLAERGIDRVPPRFAEALAIASGKQPAYLQQPHSFYFPGLPQTAWYQNESFPWVAALEEETAAMRAEIEQLLANEQGLEPYVQEHSERASAGHSLLNDARWSAFHLWKNGEPVEENVTRCPTIARLLELPPIPRIKGRSPMALVSILRPGTHIEPHTGLLNTRLIFHLPLVVPEGCRLRVGAETRDVVEGKAMIFDDSIEHEAWNDGRSVRAVLLFEIWRPEISPEERIALTAMFEAAAGYLVPEEA